MWNHAQNCTPGGDEDSNEQDRSLVQKERVEKSLDLTQYLKYLDQLFGQGTSESESSDGEESERPRAFTEFRQPPVIIQHLDRPYTHNNCLAGPSSLSEGSNHVNNFQFKTVTVDNFHAESNISSSSLSSIDSGTSSLSLNLSSDNYLDVSQTKADDTGSRKSSGNESMRQGNSFGAEDDKSVANSPDKEKKSQKKKRSARNSSEALPRQHKPSSGGKGNNGSRGGGAGGSTSGGSSNDSTEGSGGSSSSNQNTSSNSGSPGAKSHSGKQNLQKQVDSSPEVILESHVQGMSIEESCAGNNHCSDAASTDLQTLLGLHDTNSGSLLLSDDLSDNFESVHGFDSSDISSFPLNSLLDNIPDEETSLSDFISLSASTRLSSSPSTPTQSTNFFGKVAQAAANFVNKRPKGLLNNSNVNVSFKVDTKRRKVESKVDQVDDTVKPTDKQKQSKIEYFNAKRRKIYIHISKKEVIKEQKVRAITFKESIIIRRKLAYACARAVRKNELRSQKCIKESESKVRQFAHEPEIQGKVLPRVSPGTKISESKLKKNLTATNITPDNRFNHLITLMELFASRLLNNNSNEVNLQQEKNKRTSQNSKSSETVYSSNASIVDRAIKEHHNLVKLLDMTGLYAQDQSVSVEAENRISDSHEGFLKKHQIIGVNWIYNLFMKGFNGILADESGLGKKSQVAGFLSYLAESHKLWGPFLIVAPSASVCYWHEMLNKLCPKFKTIKYSGNIQDKKILRQVWVKECIHTKKDSFHIVITSYSVMVADLTYFSKIKWQYLVVDDSQNAITSSTKWMAILSFRCRSKLLLCSNPLLNSTPRLCSYLYFIMPSLFDSQKELSEWLLKELETINKRGILGDDFVSSSRLKTITKNFMLRRELHDVEMTDSVDVLLHCPLTKRQRQIYNGLLEGINLVETLNYLKNCQPQEIRNRVRNALSLSMQLRMVCNHPSLIEERACATSFWMDTPLISFPKLIYQPESALGLCNKPLLRHMFYIFSTFNVYESLYRYNSKSQNREISTWSFAHLLKMRWKDVDGIFGGNFESRLNHLVNFQSVLQKIAYDFTWVDSRDSSYLINHPTVLLQHYLSQNKVLSGLVFTSLSPFVCSWRKCKKVLIANSIQYQTLKSRHIFRGKRNAEVRSEPIHSFPTLEYPDFLDCYLSKVYSKGYMPMVSCKTFHQDIMTKENRVLISELVSKVGTSTTNVPTMVSSIKEKMLSTNWCHRFPPVHDRLIGGSGKMMVLHDLLVSLKQARRRVLIVTHIKSSIRVLEELLKTLRSKYVIVDDCKELKEEPFVYLLFAQRSLSDRKIYVDSIIFFDHDWDINMEEQKTALLQKIGHTGCMDCYRLLSSETVEDRMLALMMEKTNASPVLYKDVLENSQVSSIPALKNLYSVLMSEWQQNKGNAMKARLSITKSNSSQSSPVEVKRKCLKPTMYTTTKCINDTHINDMTDAHFMNENEGPDSAAPSYSEDQDLYIDDDDDDDVTGCQIEDNFNLSFDEGYMGMSPESFEDTTIKLDYEEHSLPKRVKLGRGSGKRGRPPSRARLNKRVDYGSDTSRRGPGRPRLKTVGPAHQGNRGRRPGRPPLTKKAESQGLASLSSGQNVFAFYSSSDRELS